MTRTAARDALLKAAGKARKPRRRIDPEQLRQMRAEGRSAREIAEAMAAPLGSVAAALSRAGLTGTGADAAAEASA
jgi:DNA-directed RNA polymerase specialized sigma24 family protein